MGLSSKQVPDDRSGNLMQSPRASAKRNHHQLQQQPPERLDCPRCGSTNTKFCYYNNYNKSQPRHFCKGCKRHWTKGGTLRNVPVGGGRKNKRQKLSDSASTVTSTCNTNMASIPIQRDSHIFDDRNRVSDAFFKALNCRPSSEAISNFPGNTFLGTFPLASNDNQSTQFSYSDVGILEANPSSISTSINQSSDVYGYTKMPETSLESTITTVMPTTTSSIPTPPWKNPTIASGALDLSGFWNWNEINSLVSADLDIPWDDAEMKF